MTNWSCNTNVAINYIIVFNIGSIKNLDISKIFPRNHSHMVFTKQKTFHSKPEIHIILYNSTTIMLYINSKNKLLLYCTGVSVIFILFIFFNLKIIIWYAPTNSIYFSCMRYKNVVKYWPAISNFMNKSLIS